jgi:hypothetical protein
MRRVTAEEPTRRGRVRCCAAAMLAGLAVAGCGVVHWPGRPFTATPGPPVPASAIHRLTVIADRAIKINAGRGVAWASAVVTTHEKALTSATPGDTVPTGGKTIVYLVTIKGHFTAVAFTGPPGAHAPTGTYLSMVIDAKTFQGLDFGLGPKPPPVAPASLGPLTYLKVGARGPADPWPGRHHTPRSARDDHD